MFWFLLLSLSARAGDVPQISWDPSRWLLQTEVGLAEPIWFNQSGAFGFQCLGFQLRAVMRCERAGEKATVRCDLEDVALQAIALARTRTDDPQDTQHTLDELRSKLLDATVVLTVDRRGHIVDMDLSGVSTRGSRETQISVVLEMVVNRALYGFAFSKRALMVLPSVSQTMPTGHVQVVNQGLSRDGRAMTQTQMSGSVVIPDVPAKSLKLQMTALADVNELGLRERVWRVKSAPRTGPPYWHEGRVQRLALVDAVDVGPTREVFSPLLNPEDNWFDRPPWPARED